MNPVRNRGKGVADPSARISPGFLTPLGRFEGGGETVDLPLRTLILFLGSDPCRMPMPRSKRCACGTKIPDLVTHCGKCNRLCACGRRIRYPGRGRPPRQCPRCSELRADRRICPCGKALRKSQRVFCSVACSKEARRIRNGAPPRGEWKDHAATSFEQRARHARVAMVVCAWLRYWKEIPVWQDGMAMLFHQGRIKWEARQTDLDFSCEADLPDLVPLDDRLRIESLLSVRPPVQVYVLANARFDTVAATRVSLSLIETFAERRCWIPRYGDYDWELSCPRERFEVHCLRRRPTF